MAKMPKLETQIRDKRVIELANVLAAEQWKGGVSEREYAAEWGVDPSTIRHLRAQATRFLRLATLGDIEEIRDRILARTELLFLRAVSSYQLDKDGNEHEWTDVKAGCAVLKLQAQLTGALVHRVEHSEAEKVKAEIESLTEEQLRERARRIAEGDGDTVH